ncbi:MAG TPA: MFS transporter [Steroidobacteraceae bacterium]|nr:MFS transporter [Steroidobacteraceae bacterium]
MSPYSAAYQRVVVLLLTAAYTFNSMDRSIISILGPSIKADLKLTDTELGLLGGTAFAMLYGLGGLPIARLAERVSRVNIMTVALIAWSGLTALCATAASFGQLLLIRVGVGVAEAGCSPPAHSLISDYFEPSRRASALSAYTGGISLGYILAAAAGGYIAQHAGWRAACAAVGLPGIVTAFLIKAVIREPLRGGSDRASAGRELPPFSVRTELAELKAVAAALLFDRPVLHMVLGLTLGAFAAYGFYYFIPAYFRREFQLDTAAVGLVSAASGGVAVGIGILAGGWLSDGLARSSPRWYALVPAIGGAISLPLYALALFATDWKSATAMLSLAGFFWYASLGPTFGVVQNVIGPRRRATATALLYICLSMLALGLGPLFVGWIIDRFAEASFAQAAFAATGSGSFRQSCPGGAAPAGAALSMQGACQSALALASQRGLLVTVGFFAWAVWHYFLAAAGIGKSLTRRAL